MAGNRAAFANKVVRALQRGGFEGARAVPEEFAIEIPGGGHLSLENVFADYERASFLSKGMVLRRLVDVVRAMTGDPFPRSIDEARANIVPIVRDQAYFANLELQETASARGRSVLEALGGDLAMSVGYDGKVMLTGIVAAQLEIWGITAEEAAKIARFNMRMRTRDGLSEIGPGLHVSPYRDNHDCSRVVLTDVISRLSLKGAPVALVPDRDTLIVTGADDPDNLLKAAEMAMEGLEIGRMVSGGAVCLHAGGWRSFMPAPGSPAHEPFRRLALKSGAAHYEQQRVLLQKQKGEDVFIAKLSGGIEPATGRWFSWAVWGEGVPTWLPVTDKLFLVSPWSEEQGLRGPWRWEVVEKVAGALMRDMQTIPPRMCVDEFPTREMIQAIARAHES